MKSSTTNRLAAVFWGRLRSPLASISSSSSSSSLAVISSREYYCLPPSSGTVPTPSIQRNKNAYQDQERSFSTAVREVSDDEEENIVQYNVVPPPIASASHRKLPFKNKKHPNLQRNNKQQSPVQVMTCVTCGLAQKEVQKEKETPLPPPLPAPVYSVHKRVLPDNLTALSSPQGRQYLLDCLFHQTAESYWALTEHFVNQSDPAFCGVTTLLMVLNACNADPNIRWKGGWRYYGDESVLLQGCCLNSERIRRVGITMEQFMVLGTCHGMNITMKRPAVVTNNGKLPPMSQPHYTLEEFRKDIRQTLDSRNNHNGSILVTSFSRSSLRQTGEGHFSPIAAYHEASDQVLILDVARFKYAPYWVTVKDLFESMEPLDEATQMPRGWYIMKPPRNAVSSWELTSEDRRPAHLVPLASEADNCPVGPIKVQYCPATKPHQLNNSANDHDNDNDNDNGKYPKELM